MGNVRTSFVGLDALTPSLEKALAVWEDKTSNDIGPKWRDISLMDFPSSLLPTTMVVDVKEPFRDSVYRYWGSQLTEIHGVDMTGKSPWDIPPHDFGQRLLVDHQRFVDGHKPEATHYQIDGVRGFTHSHTVLRMPLSDDGKSVNHFIVCADYSKEALVRFRKLGITFSDMIQS